MPYCINESRTSLRAFAVPPLRCQSVKNDPALLRMGRCMLFIPIRTKRPSGANCTLPAPMPPSGTPLAAGWFSSRRQSKSVRPPRSPCEGMKRTLAAPAP